MKDIVLELDARTKGSSTGWLLILSRIEVFTLSSWDESSKCVLRRWCSTARRHGGEDREKNKTARRGGRAKR